MQKSKFKNYFGTHSETLVKIEAIFIIILGFNAWTLDIVIKKRL